MQKTTLSTKGQAIIPVEIREKYNLKKGSRLQWIPYGTDMILVKKINIGGKPSWDEWIDAVAGLHKDIWGNIDPVAYTRKLRHGRKR